MELLPSTLQPGLQPYLQVALSLDCGGFIVFPRPIIHLGLATILSFAKFHRVLVAISLLWVRLLLTINYRAVDCWAWRLELTKNYLTIAVEI
jgi:hypothetical protein